MPPCFIPSGLAKKCGQIEEPYPDMHPGGPREGWEKQFKKQHWEFHYVNDVSLALTEPVMVTEADETKWKETYVYGAGGERVSMTYLPAYDANNGWEPTPGAGGAESGVAPRTLYYLNNALGSAIGLIEKDGRVSSRYHYDEFGIPQDAKKFDPNWPGPDNLYGYTGLGYDFNSGLTYARARYYQPELGRFISEDTYKGNVWNPQSQNLYGYVSNNPLRYVDPSGHDAIIITSDKAAMGFGHTSALYQDENGDWFYTFWGDKNVIVARVDDDNALKSLQGLNTWLQSQPDEIGDEFVENTETYDYATYVTGDFTDSLEYFSVFESNYIGSIGEEKNRGAKNEDYRLLAENCLQVTIKSLRKGTFNDGTTIFSDYYLEVLVLPEESVDVFERYFMNSSYLKEDALEEIQNYKAHSSKTKKRKERLLQ